MTGQNMVAIVGMACRFPGARDLASYWANLRAGEEGIRRFSPGELRTKRADGELTGRAGFVPAKGTLPGAHRFDWSFFGYSRAEAATIDPQQRVFLECASEAVDDAGIDPLRFPGWIGVYAGADATGLAEDRELDPLIRVIGREKDFLATRVAYKLGLRGPAVTVQTACSTSLTAVHSAVQSLLCFESDAALAGGVSVASRGQCGYLYREGGILSRDGHCRPFDADADGTVPSEGVGVVVLKRLDDAVRDHDRISAVILGSAINNDGADKIGYTAPSVTGQRDVIRLAQRLAGVDPADIGYIEAHGTGTRLGDPVEVRGLTEAFRAATEATGYCRLGSVKSNIGHAGAAAGVAGLIKTALMLRNGEFVPTVHYQSPNPLLEIEKTPFLISADTMPWATHGARLAGVSSFGVGGTNVHAVLGEAPARAPRTTPPRARLLAVSAASAPALEQSRDAVADRLDSARNGPPGDSSDLADVAWTLAAGRRRFPHRLAVVAEGPEQAAQRLRSPVSRTAMPSTTPKVAFLLPGQGLLRDGVGAHAYRLLPEFRENFDEIAGEARLRYALDLSPVVTTGTDPAWFTDTVHQQLGLLALGYSFGRQLGSWDIEPAALLGNSIGEYTAAALAGVWRLPDAVRLVHERAQAMRDTPRGRMATVNATPDRLAPLLARHPGVALAVTAPGSTVLSGTEEAITGFLSDPASPRDLEPRILETERAFHSALMEPAAARLRAAVAAVPHQPARYRLISNLTGTWTDPDLTGDPEYWAGHLRGTVRLADGMDRVLADGCDVLIELGPGASMLGGLRQADGWDADRLGVVPLANSAAPGDTGLLRALGTLWERGLDIPLETLTSAGDPYRCSLPAHPLNSRDPEASEAPRAPAGEVTAAATAGRSAAPEEQLRHELERLWCRTLGVSAVDDHDDFFALGGESLLAVHFMNRVGHHTGRHVPVAEFSAKATFGRLVQLAGRGTSLGPDGMSSGTPERQTPGLVTLRAAGSRPALFLAADGLGTTAGYRALAKRLDDDRPVYGLETSAAPRGRDTIEDIAARHIEVLRRVRPHGPYLLGGWSFGAVVAHEMAHQLMASGAEVGSLLLLDGHVPATGGLPIASVPGFLRSGLRLQLQATLGYGTVGALVRGAPRSRRLFNANIRALWRYRPRALGCPAVFLTTRGTAYAESQRVGLGAVYPRGVRVRPVGGGHWSMLAEPHVGQLAETIRWSLESAAPVAGAAEHVDGMGVT
ncbi:type I polyketide synthase [Streptomyces sp. NPDC057307]|uniref:type I polyketide synthase n=1 Tax=Streptomyces sp. NPDC057307 TaxID=3346096 RepID=UPI00362D19C8